MHKTLMNKIRIVISLCVLIIIGLVVLFVVPERDSSKDQEVIVNTPIPTSVPTSDPSESEEKPVEEDTKEDIKIDLESDTSLTRLINQAYPIDQGYKPNDLIVTSVPSLHDEQTIRKELDQPLNDLFKDAKDNGMELMVVSGYRDFDEQTSLWYTYCEKYGLAYTRRMDAHPGACEHQLGLAVDLGVKSRKCELYQCFEDMNGYDWLVEHAYEYGFIQRYPKGGESSTGIMYSPWHFRYVGKDLAKKIHESNQTMEEYFEKDWK